MSNIDEVTVGLSVVLGEAIMPVHQLLRMGRGAVISLDRTESDLHLILAEEVPIALGTVEVDRDKISLRVSEWLPRPGIALPEKEEPAEAAKEDAPGAASEAEEEPGAEASEPE